MTDVAYRQYLIVSAPEFNPLTLTWTPNVTVSWKTDGGREQQVLTSLPSLFSTARRAEDCGVKEAIRWIDSCSHQP
jgi:hypothetical protein